MQRENPVLEPFCSPDGVPRYSPVFENPSPDGVMFNLFLNKYVPLRNLCGTPSRDNALVFWS
jgi:hypothetical protein